MVSTSPLLRVAAPLAQPSVEMVLPVWLAPLTRGVEAVKVPVVCVGRTGS